MKLADILIAEDIMTIIAEEITLIKKNPQREAGDLIKLEKLTKSFSVITATVREMVKSGVLGQLTSDELDKKLDDGADEEDDSE